MCGIAGIHTVGAGAPPTPGELAAMIGPLHHRGPEATGGALDDRCGLAMARLSFVDLAGGMQPLRSGDDSIWLVCNGEIFNHRELRADLEGRGHRFRSGSDCETALHLYEERGFEFVTDLNGDFAIALWDRRRRRLVLARDRVGVRPLYWTQLDGRLLFASEIKALVGGGLRPRLDAAGLAETLTHWAPLPPRTLFQGVEALPPGGLLVASESGLEIRRYWTPPLPALEPRRLTSAETRAAAEELDALLDDAVRRRIDADVPIGAYLSGGLDSSLLCALVRRHDVPLDTFSIAFADARFDERTHQAAVARALGTRHHMLTATPADIAKALPDVVWHAESVLLRTAPAPLYLLAGLVREHGYKAVLSGEGADEFWVGYDIFKETAVRAFWARQPESRLRPALVRRLYPDIPELHEVNPGFLAAFFGTDLGAAEEPGFSHGPRWRTTGRLRRLLEPAVLRQTASEEARDLAALLARVPRELHPVATAQAVEVATFLEPYLLAAQGDRVAMAHSVETRVPYLDHRVIELAGRLPVSSKLAGLEEKALLRRVAAPLLPPSIAGRVKKPYRAPIQDVLGPRLLDELLDPAWLAEDGVLRPAAVSALHTRAVRGTLSETDQMGVTALCTYALLRDQFFSGPLPQTATAPLEGMWDRRRTATPAVATPLP